MKRRVEVCVSLLVRYRNDSFLHRIVTCDEKWILYDNSKRSYQWLDADEPPGHHAKPKQHAEKLMVSVWWTWAGVVHFTFTKPGTGITAASYCTMMQKLASTQSRLVNREGPLLLHDNAKPHTARITLQKLRDLNLELLPHPPYSPDLSPTDYYFFQNLDNFLHEKKSKMRSR